MVWEGKSYYICNVYSACTISLKRDLWNNLLDLMSRYKDGDWVIGGGFNAVKYGGERKGRSARGSSSERE